MEQELNKAQNGPGGDGKVELGPNPQKDFKKGQWTRINRPFHDAVEEVSYGVDSLKRKGRETQAHEDLKTEKEKKQKLEEVTTKQSALFVTQWGSVEIAEQPHQEQ